MSDIFDLNTLWNGRAGAERRMREGIAKRGLRFEQVGRYTENQHPRISGNMPGIDDYLRRYTGETEWVEGGLILRDTLLADRYGLPYVTGSDFWLSGNAVSQPPVEELKIPPMPDPASIHHIDRAIVIGGRGAAIYGHWLLDFVPQILTARGLGRKLGNPPPILMVNYTPFGRRLLNFLGLEKDCIFVRRDTPVQLSEMWLPLITKREWAYSVEVLKRGFTYLLETATASGHMPPLQRVSKILVARKKPPFCDNFEALRAALEPRGFTVVQPEKIPYRKQFQLFNHAEIVVGEDGSAMHNAGFCRPGTPIIVYSRARRGAKINWWHGAVAQVADASLHYLQSHMTETGYDAPIDEIMDLVSATQHSG